MSDKTQGKVKYLTGGKPRELLWQNESVRFRWRQ